MIAQNYALHTTLRPLHTDMCFSHTRTPDTGLHVRNDKRTLASSPTWTPVTSRPGHAVGPAARRHCPVRPSPHARRADPAHQQRRQIRTRTRASKNQGATTGWAPAGARYEAGIPRRRRETRRRNRTCADGYAPGRRLGMPASYGSPHRVVPSSSSNKGCPRFLSCDPRPPRAEEDRELGDASVAR